MCSDQSRTRRGNARRVATGGGALEGQAPQLLAVPPTDEKNTVKHWSRSKIHLIIYGFHVSVSSKQNPKPIAILTIRNFFLSKWWRAIT